MVCLLRILAVAVKHDERNKLGVTLKRLLEGELDRSASGIAAWLAADQTSPPGQAERNQERYASDMLARFAITLGSRLEQRSKTSWQFHPATRSDHEPIPR